VLTYVYQKHFDGCAAAALATLMGTTYEEAQRNIRHYRGGRKYTATAQCLARILRRHGYTCTPVRSVPDDLELPVLIKQNLEWTAHCLVWSPAQKRLFDPSGYDNPTPRMHLPCFMQAAIETGDEPAYVVNHPRFRKWLADRASQASVLSLAA